MSARSLFDPVIDSGIRNPHFFEGRLLTAEALREDQKAHRERQRLLGRALGAGVAEGLTVTLEPAGTDGLRKTVTIARGFAIDGEGEPLRLNEDVTAEVVPPTVVPEAPATLFARCEDAIQPQPTVPVGVGLYILVMSPASGYRDRAPMSGLGREGKVIGCGDRYAVDGVRFRLEPLQPSMISGASSALRTELTTLLNATGDPAKRSQLRNLIAHLCFGTTQTASFAADPFARSEGASALLTYGALDDLRALERLTECDVPLALLLWNTSGIAFLDLWAVRRRPVPLPRSADWPLIAGERAAAEGEARWLQFQAQLAELIETQPAPTLIAAQTHFRYLPPAGLLPLQDPARAKGVTVPGFFAGRTYRGPVFVEGARLQAILAAARSFAPVDLGQQEMTWVYLIRENRQPIAPTATAPGAATALFASGHLPFFGDARFDVNRWNYSNYGSLLVR
jgi:hypothetical protein